LINQLATPGLGSLLAGRYLAGIGQLLLALAGFGMVVGWFGIVLLQLYSDLQGQAQPKPMGWMGAAGALTFAASWLWALVTTFSILKEAREKDQDPNVPPHLPPV